MLQRFFSPSNLLKIEIMATRVRFQIWEERWVTHMGVPCNSHISHEKTKCLVDGKIMAQKRGHTEPTHEACLALVVSNGCRPLHNRPLWDCWESWLEDTPFQRICNSKENFVAILFLFLQLLLDLFISDNYWGCLVAAH